MHKLFEKSQKNDRSQYCRHTSVFIFRMQSNIAKKIRNYVFSQHFTIHYKIKKFIANCLCYLHFLLPARNIIHSLIFFKMWPLFDLNVVTPHLNLNCAINSGISRIDACVSAVNNVYAYQKTKDGKKCFKKVQITVQFSFFSLQNLK